MLELEDYYDLLDTLNGGYGINLDQDDLEEQLNAFRRICCLLWVKNSVEETLFDQQFSIFLNEKKVDLLEEQEAEKIRESHKRKKEEEAAGKEEEKDKSATESNSNPAQVQPLEIPAPALKAKNPANPYKPKRHQVLLSDQYYPLKRREMQQSWRHLHRSERIGFSNMLDVNATVKAFARKGYLEKPVFLPRFQNQIDLSILVDVGGSMVAYDQLCMELIRTAREGGRVRNVNAFYFRNIPDDKIYLNPGRTEWISIPEFLFGLESMRSSVLIISDAGTARNTRSLNRLFQTELFLEEVRNITLRMAWLNPFPANRWEGTSAAKIATWVSMFYLNRSGLDQAIDVLKGKMQL